MVKITITFEATQSQWEIVNDNVMGEFLLVTLKSKIIINFFWKIIIKI